MSTNDLAGVKILTLYNKASIKHIDGITTIVYPDGSPMAIQNVNSVLGSSIRGEVALKAFSQFMELHDIPKDLTADVNNADAYSSDEAAQIGVGLVNSAFPIYVEIWPTQRYSDGFYGTKLISSERIDSSYGARTIEEFITSLFGLYRKDLVKAVVNSKDVYSVFWGSIFTGHMPIEWIIDYINRGVHIDTMGFSVDQDKFDAMLALLTRYENRRLLHTTDAQGAFNIVEASRILSDLPAELVSLPVKRTGDELHDHFTLVSKGIEQDAVFNIPPEVEKLDGYKVGDLTVRVLRSREEFLRTGEVMNNCAGTVTYAIDASEEKTTLIRFDTMKEEFKYLLELRKTQINYEITQLFGVSNTKVSEEDTRAIHALIEREVNG